MTEDLALAEAGRLIAAGRYDQALKLLAGLTSPLRHGLQGAALLGRRHAGPALQQFRQAVAVEPGNVGHWLGLGRAHLAALQADIAVALLEALNQRAPDLPGLAESLASAYRRDARYEDALTVAESCAAPSPSLLYERALSLLQLGQAADSLQAFDHLLERAPSHAAGWFWSHAPALDLVGWDEAERRLAAAAACPGANRKYQGFLAGYDVLRGAADPRPCPTPYHHLRDAAQAMRARMRDGAPLFGVHAAMLRWSLAAATQPGLLLEFGVRRGNSIRVLAGETTQDLHGFDSFEGLPEGWVKAQAGVLTTGGELPTVPSHVTLHRGWFEDSLPPFLARHDAPLRFVNIDSDIYSSARTVLWALRDRIRPGSVLLFDELIGNRSWRHDEYKALCEFSAAFGLEWDVLAVSLANKQVAVRLTAV